MVILRPYQQDAVKKLKKLYKTNNKAILAMTTGSGKTETIIDFILKHPGKTFLILGHAQRNLRKNITDRIKGRDMNCFEIQSASQVGESNDYEIVTALPQNIYKNLELLEKFDYLIVDEAHQYYGTDKRMYGEILKWHGGKELLVTASHYDLDGPKVFYSRQEALEQGYVSDAKVSLCGIENTGITRSVFTRGGDLDETYELTDTTYTGILDKITKTKTTMIVTHNTAFAKKLLIRVRRKFGKKSSELSDCYTDPDSANMAKFKKGDVRILIVVMRGNIGFDYPKLEHVIDASYSKNIKRLEQLLGRVSRPCGRRTKAYDKLIPADMFDEYLIYISGVMSLGVKEIYESWKGKKSSLPVKLPGDGLTSSAVIDRIRMSKFKVSGHYSTSFGEYINLWEGDKGFSTTMKKAVDSCLNYIDPEGKKVILLNMLRKGEPKPKRGTWQNTSLRYARKDASFRKEFEELEIKTFPDTLGWIGLWTFEKCKNNAKKYKTRSDWHEGSASSYQAAFKSGWLDECLPREKIKWTFERCKNNAKKYKTRTEWMKHSSGAYCAARRKDWLDEVCAHMQPGVKGRPKKKTT